MPRFVLIAATVLLLTGCPGGSRPCDATNCQGCCTGAGVCELGQQHASCGRGGSSCTNCLAQGQQCDGVGLCVATTTSTGGGSATTTGGGTGTGTSRELLTSGTRLKVVTVVGADGSRQQLAFWDTQLQLVCGFAAYWSGSAGARAPSRCLPTGYFLTESVGQPRYLDAACTDALRYGSSLVYTVDTAGSYGASSGGFAAVQGAVRHTTTTVYSRLSDGGCLGRPVDGQSEGLYFTISQFTTLTDPFVSASVVIE